MNITMTLSVDCDYTQEYGGTANGTHSGNVGLDYLQWIVVAGGCL